MSSSTTYSSYLKLDRLLDLQDPRPGKEEHDEMLFIIIHQVYELWFKQILHELDYLQVRFANDGDGVARILHTLRRVLKIFKTLVKQIDVLETMTPIEFLSFRNYLDSASGFQSFQFRELEFLLGYKRPLLVHYPEGTDMRRRLDERYAQPSIWDGFLHFLAGNGYAIPKDVLARDVSEAIAPSKEVQKALIHIYRTSPRMTAVCETLIDLDEGIQEWRYRHVKMVERTIGSKRGTGGSAGVEYLKTTLFRPVFPDLWAIRTEL